jgi:hypothetical protein
MRRVARCQGCHERGRHPRRPYFASCSSLKPVAMGFVLLVSAAGFGCFPEGARGAGSGPRLSSVVRQFEIMPPLPSLWQ